MVFKFTGSRSSKISVPGHIRVFKACTVSRVELLLRGHPDMRQTPLMRPLVDANLNIFV